MSRLLLALLLFCGGCAASVSEGEICGKSFSPAHTETNISPTLDSEGQVSISTTIERVPDRWFISIKKYDEQAKEWRFNNIRVSKEQHDNCQIGDYYRP